MDNPGTIGSDLIVDSVAAMNEYPLPLAVIDMGTATTIFVVNKNKEYIGFAVYNESLLLLILMTIGL